MQTKRETRGGFRPGSGRKSKPTLSAALVDKALKEAQKYKREHGKSIEQLLLDIIYHQPNSGQDAENEDSISHKLRLDAMRLFFDKFYIQPKEGGEADKTLGGPEIYLPERQTDPTKVVPITINQGS